MRVMLISHAATAAMREGRFPADWRSVSGAARYTGFQAEPVPVHESASGDVPGWVAGIDPYIHPEGDELDARGRAEVESARMRLLDAWPGRAHGVVLTSPAPCAVESARVLGLGASVTDALADIDYGRWHGISLKALASEEPDALAAWCRDPAAAAHGGESFGDVVARVGGWLESLAGPADVIAVTHATILRAAIVYVLDAPLMAFTRIDIAPLTAIELRRSEFQRGDQTGDQAGFQTGSRRGWVWRTR